MGAFIGLTLIIVGLAMMAHLFEFAHRVTLYELLALVAAISLSVEFVQETNGGFGNAVIMAALVFGTLMVPKALLLLFRGRRETTIFIIRAQRNDETPRKIPRMAPNPARFDPADIRERVSARYRLEKKP